MQRETKRRKLEREEKLQVINKPTKAPNTIISPESGVQITIPDQAAEVGAIVFG